MVPNFSVIFFGHKGDRLTSYTHHAIVFLYYDATFLFLFFSDPLRNIF